MKCQILFSGKNKKNNIILSSAENAQRVVKVKYRENKGLKPTSCTRAKCLIACVFRANSEQ